jgi:pimeloyl-ACP methyl ester carboxylesterase
MTVVRIAGADIAFEARGKGPAVLLLHAFPLSRAMWDAQTEALAAMHQVVRFDCRGFGATPPDDGLLTMERIADDGAALLDYLEIAKAMVVGCSMGGYAAFAMVRRHADRLKALALVDTRAIPDTPAARQSRSVQAERVRKEGVAAAVELFPPKLLGATTYRERPTVVARTRELILANPARGIANALIGLGARADSQPTLREIGVPTLVITGSEDQIVPLSETEQMQAAIAGSRLVVLPGAGHLPSLEDPPAFSSALVDFLAKLR